MLIVGMGDQRYALDVGAVADVIPMVHVRALPHTPDYVAGIFSYHGTVVPVIDLCQLTLGRPCRERLSTRTVLLHFPGQDGRAHLLGLRAEHVLATARVRRIDISSAQVEVEDAPYLGDVFSDERGLVQCLQVDRLLPESLRDSLFAVQDKGP